MVREESLISHNSMMNPHLLRKSSLDEALNRSKDTKDSSGEINYKTELCRTWVEKNFCPYKEKCRFAHGKRDLHEKMINSKNYKQKECNSFYQRGFCPYGPRCHFKHEERRLEEISRGYYPFLLYSQNTIDKLNSFNLKNSRFYPQNHRLQIFEKIRGHTPSALKLIPFEDIKSGREFILPRKILDSCM